MPQKGPNVTRIVAWISLQVPEGAVQTEAAALGTLEPIWDVKHSSTGAIAVGTAQLLRPPAD